LKLRASASNNNAPAAAIKSGILKALQIGNQVFENLPAILEDSRKSETGRIEDGLLPTKLFRSVYVNNQEGYVVFDAHE
jgi:hypothetical protein